ncbi:uncharacterized protein PHACADRAFT_120365 [Phanerochaete carnosa HHB-10118-sp]|uniref:Alpha/beta hydrolase fold-3 domain-containing protein n=1 Tax=Phanerochaete carnosa (strain HHB-10118-sp) TaxID=650164 RepID=K5WXL4_PHACS|nr:uncharacterized protein PHACADRAFT_120365 [Phanerochaete carnosa HHB-10118-sp]EKM55227.1 hypothetical protein PHACADRAFT_120365 [Phanerochaete carnosa HHB-10118-sp]
MFAFKNQPLKLAYLLVTVPVLLFVRLPYWLIVASIPSLRPRKSWNMVKTLNRYICEAKSRSYYDIGLDTPEGNPVKDSRDPGATGFVWVDAVPSQLVTGEIADLARRNGVEPAGVYGYWYGARDEAGKHGQRATKGERVLYFLHGMSSTLHIYMGSPHPSGYAANVVRGFLEKCPKVAERAFGLAYRLASSAPYPSANPFPAAVIDLISGYHYLVETLGFEPSNIIVWGDSSAGHLVIDLVRYLVSTGLPSLPPPGALIMVSPTLDWANTHLNTPASTIHTNKNVDFVYPFLLSGYTLTSIRGSLSEHEFETNTWASPASLKLEHTDGLFANYPPTYILAGEAEQTVDAMRTFRDRLIHDNGKDKVHYVEYQDMYHGWLVNPLMEPDRSQAYGHINAWLTGIWGL